MTPHRPSTSRLSERASLASPQHFSLLAQALRWWCLRHGAPEMGRRETPLGKSVPCTEPSCLVSRTGMAMPSHAHTPRATQRGATGCCAIARNTAYRHKPRMPTPMRKPVRAPPALGMNGMLVCRPGCPSGGRPQPTLPSPTTAVFACPTRRSSTPHNSWKAWSRSSRTTAPISSAACGSGPYRGGGRCESRATTHMTRAQGNSHSRHNAVCWRPARRSWIAADSSQN
ncbi:Uncharacterised protein [Mycobacteroides abscessus subsp. abscessus]|nr:Uncharacterised protein [Mycobacteroides abscessus]SHZ28768.1 Uncharacterised protein [Mycobacteroides abscessus subsp. abscessus]SKF58592.1 Uncharacterised protein [Mycobacteroides abscessus subsp. abscessus]SKZ66877.1 Uncharacterised protein [Mycobacteroides abscessus subsp. abscessus]